VSITNSGALYVSLFALVALWFLLIALLWKHLIAHHPAKYEELNRPNFFSALGLFSTLRFVLRREHRLVGDRTLGLKSDAALAVLILYIVVGVLIMFHNGTSR
jgi:hypothetical protein